MSLRRSTRLAVKTAAIEKPEFLSLPDAPKKRALPVEPEDPLAAVKKNRLLLRPKMSRRRTPIDLNAEIPDSLIAERYENCGQTLLQLKPLNGVSYRDVHPRYSRNAKSILEHIAQYYNIPNCSKLRKGALIQAIVAAFE